MARTINRYRHCDVRDAATRHEAWGIFDAKGREYGMVIQTLAVMVSAGPPALDALDQRETYLEPGLWFSANVQTARGGKPYGASQSSRYFRREAERVAYIKARIEQAKKRVQDAQRLNHAPCNCDESGPIECELHGPRE